MPRAAPAAQPPEGLVYRPGFVSETDERELLGALDALEFHEVRMRGQAARRTARHYGYAYDYEQPGRLVPGEPVPDWLRPLRGDCADLVDVPAERLAEALVQRYPPGATIGWHRDAPTFGRVVGVSLAAPCRMRFRRTKGGEREVFDLELEPRSAYVLAGAARSSWQHSIPPAREPRYSITFRTVRDRR